MTFANLPPLVTVFGGSGFVGRHVVRVLAQRGYRVRVAVRRPDLAGFVLPFGNVGQISLSQANLRYRDSVAKAVEGASVVVNCVGILLESGRNKFDAVQDFGARAVAEAATAAGARLVHISAIGADAKSASSYAASKGRGEDAIRQVTPGAVILRPSIVFGPEDSFFNKFAAMARLSPVLPLIGGGKTKFQPVFVEDVAEAVAKAVDGKVAAGLFELGGPEVLTFRQCLEEMLRVIDRTNPLVSLPFGIASLLASVASAIPLITPPLTNDQLTLLKSDNVVSEAAKKEGRTLTGLGITPTAVAAVLPSYLIHFRPHGQYSRSGKAA
ncbi:complex I NDUFA9 subunit family protein [Agrobacterium vitis]|uniref:complex I NDUFA9 subunit family protein n=1 Tax=Agrobacterium vitis TaxID=373 RepID=UPI00157450C8|nr:complex I NDUFA9 subunit family protein [Agrobacterium vitis]NSZ15417.1 complex I NDUFA9 subunit family protein [Agrobacterium vitis]QZO04277.1 complex I NDUFA9 subunit family protein [Agrobacterium vitis]UJL89406.1 complex I NDUFA9 subunit family protein [Agrobacterium vitis]